MNHAITSAVFPVRSGMSSMEKWPALSGIQKGNMPTNMGWVSLPQASVLASKGFMLPELSNPTKAARNNVTSDTKFNKLPMNPMITVM